MTHRPISVTGILLLSLAALPKIVCARTDKPAVSVPALTASHVICGAQFKPDPRNAAASLKQCADAAAAFYKEEWAPQVRGVLSGDPQAFSSLVSATTFELPDGAMISGSSMGMYFPTLFGENAAQVIAISDDFTFKPIDADTVMVFGTPKFTVKNKDGATYVLTSAQLSVYRRTYNAVTPRGWEELGEFWTYQTPNKGPKPALPPGTSVPAPPASKPAK